MEIFVGVFLRGLNLDSKVLEVTQTNCIKTSKHLNPRETSLLMTNNSILQIPILDKKDKFIGLEISDDLIPNSKFPTGKNSALLMAVEWEKD